MPRDDVETGPAGTQAVASGVVRVRISGPVEAADAPAGGLRA